MRRTIISLAVAAALLGGLASPAQAGRYWAVKQGAAATFTCKTRAPYHSGSETMYSVYQSYKPYRPTYQARVVWGVTDTVSNYSSGFTPFSRPRHNVHKVEMWVVSGGRTTYCGKWVQPYWLGKA